MELDVDIFVVGEDWGDKPHNVDVENYLRSQGKKIVPVLYNTRTSSTKIKQNVIAQPQSSTQIEQLIVH
jgi:glycerol-3-phosphate cytidylyltransferase